MPKKHTKQEVNACCPNTVHDFLNENILVDGYDLVCDLKKSKGMELYDAKSENYYFDFFSFFASLPIGFNHPKLTTKDFLEKLAQIAVNKPSLSDIYTVEMAQFVSTFRRVAAPDNMKYLFFISGGALAVENALKVAFDWKVKKNLKAGKGEKGKKIIHYVRAFHGRSGYTLSLTNSPDPRKTDYFPQFDWPRVLNPKCTFPIEDHIDEIEELEKKSIAQIKEAIKNNPDDIAAIIIEPIQGEGGDNQFRKEYFQALRDICDENEILLIFDEVQSGMGITGKMWAYQHFGVEPDIVSFGKKSQVCGIMVSDRIDDIEDHCFRESSRINSTWGGNLVDMVRSQRVLEIIEEEKLVEQAAEVGEHLLKRLAELRDENPELISNVRGKGLMCAFDIATPEKRNALIAKLYEKKVIILSCGDNSIRFRPSLIATKDDIDRGIALIKEALAETKA